MIAVDFFCGAGGLSRGLLNVGVSVVLGIDVKASFRQTYESNNAPSQFLAKDIRDVTASDILSRIATTNTKDLLFVGCAPCQPFTKLRKDYAQNEERTLLLDFGRLVSELRPGQIVLENVPRITEVPGYSTYRRFKKMLQDLKYNVAEGVLDAKNFGVPQTRRRYIMIAGYGIMPSLPTPTHGYGRLSYETVRKAINKYPPLKAGESNSAVPNHRAAELSALNLKRIHHTPKNGGSRYTWRKSLVLACHGDSHQGHSDVYGRMWWDRPAPALTCRFWSISNGRYGHPKQDRGISLREGAKLQTFDDSFIFYGNSKDIIAQQIGNAVPVKFAEAIGGHIRQLRERPDIFEWQNIHRFNG
jgi:DNA (cytosine-5)-methyltransferase 1